MSIPPVLPMQSLPIPPEEGKVQDILDRHCKDFPKDIPVGCNLVIMREGKEPTRLHAGKILSDGPQNWGSTSKQFTAACIDKLVKDKKITYDQDIRTVCPKLPEFKLNGIVQKVTVDDLLHMRSGLPEVWATALMTGVDAERLNNEELLELLHKHPGMVFSPGSKQMYCNTNYYLLAKIVENVSGLPFIDYVRKEVLSPLGMQARCSIDPSCPKTIPGYDGDPKSETYMKEVTSPNRSYGTTGLIGPPSDMIKWNAAIEHKDYNLLERPKGVVASPEGLYCRGLIVDQAGDYLKISHGGALSGAVTIYRRYEHKGKTFAFFLATNVDSVPKAEKIANDVANVLAEREIEREIQRPEEELANSKEKDAQAFRGSYLCQELGTEWIVEAKEKEPGKWAVQMIPSDRRNFPRFDFDPKIKDGNLVFQTGYGAGIINLTSNGLVYEAENMAPIHFTRI